MIIVIWIIGLVLSLVNAKYNNKYIRILELYCIIYILTCNNRATDEMNLYRAYRLHGEGTYTGDITGYIYADLLMGLANKFHLSFGMFNFLTIAPMIILLEVSLRKLVKNTSIVLFLYSLTSVMLDTTLIRQFIASIFVVYAMQYIFGGNCNNYKFIFWIIIASLVHFSMLFFLVMVLLNSRIKQALQGYLWVKNTHNPSVYAD